MSEPADVDIWAVMGCRPARRVTRVHQSAVPLPPPPARRSGGLGKYLYTLPGRTSR